MASDRGASPLTPLPRAPKAAESIAAQVRDLVASGELKEGDQLPPEAQLLQHFQVSRPSLREALRILESEGLITVGKGSRAGARIKRPGIETIARYASLSLQIIGAPLSQIYEAEMAIGPFAARLLAARRDPRDVAKLRAQLAHLERLLEADDAQGYSTAVTHFHLMIIELTGNHALMLIGRMLSKILEAHETLCRVARKQSGHSEAKSVRTLGPRSFAKVIALIERGDVAGTEKHWSEHIRNAARYWLEAQKLKISANQIKAT